MTGTETGCGTQDDAGDQAEPADPDAGMGALALPEPPAPESAGRDQRNGHGFEIVSVSSAPVCTISAASSVIWIAIVSPAKLMSMPPPST